MNNRDNKETLSAVRDADRQNIEKKWAEIYPELEKITLDTVSVLNCLKENMNRSSKHKIIDTISWRIKEPDSIISKLSRKERDISIESAMNTLHDLIGIRMICYYQDDVYGLLDKLNMMKELKIVKVKDYIHTPKSGGYRSIHVIIKFRSTQIGTVLGNYSCDLLQCTTGHVLNISFSIKTAAKLTNYGKS